MNIIKLFLLTLCFTPIIALTTHIESLSFSFSPIEASEQQVQHLNLGFSNTTGNTRNLDVNAKYDFSSTLNPYQEKKLKILFDSSAFFTKTDSTKTNEEYLLNLALEQELGKKWLSYFTLNWLRNPEFKNYDHKTSTGAGLGKNLYFDDQRSLTLKIGASLNSENHANAQLTERFSSLNEYLEYNNQLNQISKLYVKVGALQNFEAFNDDYELISILGVNFNVGEKTSLNIEQEIAYDNIPPLGFKKTDTKSIVRLGYQF